MEDADSDPFEVALAKAIFLSPTTGSSIVNVCTLSLPTVALEGFDKVKITVSFPSTLPSSTIPAIVMVPEVAPALMVKVPLASV